MFFFFGRFVQIKFVSLAISDSKLNVVGPDEMTFDSILLFISNNWSKWLSKLPSMFEIPLVMVNYVANSDSIQPTCNTKLFEIFRMFSANFSIMKRHTFDRKSSNNLWICNSSSSSRCRDFKWFFKITKQNNKKKPVKIHPIRKCNFIFRWNMLRVLFPKLFFFCVCHYLLLLVRFVILIALSHSHSVPLWINCLPVNTIVNRLLNDFAHLYRIWALAHRKSPIETKQYFMFQITVTAVSGTRSNKQYKTFFFLYPK